MPKESSDHIGHSPVLSFIEWKMIAGAIRLDGVLTIVRKHLEKSFSVCSEDI